MPYVYMLLCADGTLYTGWTTDLTRRLAEHAGGRGARYTSGRRPVCLVYCEAQPHRVAAQRQEAALRRLSRAAKLQLVAGWRSEPPPALPTSPAEPGEM
jgi:predicted GIY-YIG superfamily endonuclease